MEIAVAGHVVSPQRPLQEGPPDIILPDRSQCADISKTLSAIDQVQAAIHAFSKDHASIGDVLHRGARLRLDAAGLTLVLSSAQEELYASLLAFQGDEVGRIESLLKEVPRPDASSHAPLQTQIGQTKATIDCLTQWKEELVAIIQSPDPLIVAICNDGSPSLPPPQHKALHNRAEVLLTRCQALLGQHEELCGSLQEAWRERFSSNLEECERWLREVYSLMCLEPHRAPLAWSGEERGDLDGEEEMISDEEGQEVDREDEEDGEEEEEDGHNNEGLKEETNKEDMGGEEEEEVKSDEDRVTVRDLEVLPLMHLKEWEVVDDSITFPSCDISSELKKRYLELGEMQHRVLSAEASLALMVGSAPLEETSGLRATLGGVVGLLGPLEGRLAHRRAQLEFEKIQKDILGELMEAELELEDQSLVLLDQSVQQAHTNFKEFFTTPEHFRAQVEEQLKEMEALVGQLLSFGREDASLLDHTFQQLKNTCHVICSRVSEQMLLLERWVEFDQCYGCLGDWLAQAEEKVGRETYGSTLEEVASFGAVLEALSSDMEGRRSEEKESLHQRYGDLKPRLSEANAHKVEQAMLELQVRWSELQDTLRRRRAELCSLRDKVEHFWSVLGEVKGCLVEMERRYDQCGPIGAHLERLLEQGPILQALDEDFLTHKEDPDRVCAEAAEVGLVWGGGKEELSTKAEQLRKQFVDFSERLVEQREWCEEAVAAMQQLQKEYDTFGQSLCEASNKHKLWTERRAPIGVIGSELEEYYDFMRETEGLTKQYSSLHCHSQQLSSKYKPSDHLEGMMVSMNTRWAELVAMLEQHCGEKLSLKGRWEEYAGEVKGLLGWMTQEANRFSREVTEKGEQGIEDHVESCQVFTDTLGAKVGCREKVLTLGEELLPHDAEKKNGTSDVASRIHDVQVHWESVCKLLEETILRLEATKAQLGYILQVTGEEFDWLERMEERSRDQKASHGRIEVVEEEINLHETMYQEVESHAHFKTFICEEALKFTLEHLRGKDRGPAAMRAKDFASRYESLYRKLGAYVGNLRESIPLWAQFTGLQGTLVQQLGDARGKLGSVNSKTFMTTQKSLEVVKLLSAGLGTMQDSMSTLVQVCGDLRPLCVQEDQNYIQQLVGEVSDDLGDLTSHVEESVESLEQRMKSWEVLPVEDVMAVQEFLEQAQNMMMSSEGEETSEDLEEKVKRLESMLQSQDTNAQKVDYIDLSSKSEAVKESLEKNPDISQEKDRLLSGWSSVSVALKRKFEETRKCASITKEMESLLARCQMAMEEYQTFLSQPLPPVTGQQEILCQQSSLHSSCEEAVSMVTSTLKRSLAEGIAVPPHLQGKAEAVVDHFDGLTSQANQRARGISQTLARWQNFTVTMEKCRSQLPDFQSELSGLAQVEEFLMELSSLESRLSILEEKVQADMEELEEMRRDLPSHLFGDDLQVTAKMADFSHLVQQWTELKDSVERLKADLIPWRKLVDVQEELQNRFDQLRATVEEQLEDARRSGTGEEKNASHYLYVLKGLLSEIERYTPQVDVFHQSYVPWLGAKVCSRHPPAQQFSDVCVRLEDDWRNLLQRLRGSVEEMAVKEEQEKLMEYRETLMREMQTSQEGALHQCQWDLARTRQEMIGLRRLLATNRQYFDTALAAERHRLTEKRGRCLRLLEQKQQSTPTNELHIEQLKKKVEIVGGHLIELERRQNAIIDVQLCTEVESQLDNTLDQSSPEQDLVLKHVYSRGLEATPLPSDFMCVIATRVPEKWATIALALGLTSHQVQCIQQSASSDAGSCLLQVFEAWEGLGTGSCTWGTVVVALESVGCGHLAQDLRAKLTMSHDMRDDPSLSPPHSSLSPSSPLSSHVTLATPYLVTVATSHLLQPRDIGVLLTTAAPVRSHWRAIGHHLGFTEGQLDSMVPPNHTSHLRVLLIRWLEGAGPCTEVFIGAMRAVGVEGVARQVEMDGFLMSPWRVKYETAV